MAIKTAKITTVGMELALSSYFDYRTNLIVPNVSWGMNIHECDLLVVTKAGYCTEVEIKVTRADLRADAKKWHGHNSPMLKSLWFALPDYLDHCLEFVPARAGILLVRAEPNIRGVYPHFPRIRVVRNPEINKNAPKLTESQRYKVARLGALRIWGLKRKLL